MSEQTRYSRHPGRGFLGEGLCLAPQNHVTYLEAKLSSFAGERGVTQPVPTLSGGDTVQPYAPGEVPTPHSSTQGTLVSR